jgi:hypothetical protein
LVVCLLSWTDWPVGCDIFGHRSFAPSQRGFITCFIEVSQCFIIDVVVNILLQLNIFFIKIFTTCFTVFHTVLPKSETYLKYDETWNETSLEMAPWVDFAKYKNSFGKFYWTHDRLSDEEGISSSTGTTDFDFSKKYM